MFGGKNTKNKSLFLQSIAFAAFFLCASFTSPAHSADITSNLEGHWTLDDGAGSTAVDATGNNNGALQGAPEPGWVAGQVGTGALDFSGGDGQYVALTGLSTNTNTLTMTAWINLDAKQDYDGILYSRNGANVSGISIAPTTNNLGYNWDNATANWNTGPALPTSEWVFVAIAIEPTKATAYVGDSSGSLTSAVNVVANAAVLLDNWKIGIDEDNAARIVDGRIDDVRIYSRTLSQADITALYIDGLGAKPCNAAYEGVMLFNDDQTAMQYCNGTDWISIGHANDGDNAGTCSNPAGTPGEMNYNLTQGIMQYCNGASWVNMGPHITGDSLSGQIPTANLAGHWPFEDGSGTTAADNSANNNTGTLANMDGSTDWVTGKVGDYALDFDGTDDYVNAGSDASLDNTAQTITAWIYPTSAGTGDTSVIARKGDSSEGWSLYLKNASGEQALGWTTKYDGDHSYKKTADSSITLNTWQHIAITGGNQFYINGKAVTTTNVQSSNGVKESDETHDLIIGDIFAGKIDDVRIYSSALTADEIEDLYLGTGGETSDPCSAATPTNGEVCNDGTIYAGLTLDDNSKMFIMPCDIGMTWDASAQTCSGTRTTMEWGGGTLLKYCRYDTPISVTECITGAANTAAYDAADAASAPDNDTYTAVNACADLSYGGYDDWYLPAKYEYGVIYYNLVSPDDPNTTNYGIGHQAGSRAGIWASLFDTGYYWGSSEQDNGRALSFNMNSGHVSGPTKPTLLTVRCARKGYSPEKVNYGTCSNPNGVIGEIVYNDDINVMQYCNGTRWTETK